MASVKLSVPAMVASSSEPVADVLPEKEPESFTDVTYQADDLCFGVALVISDSHSKRIRPVEVGVWCVRPCSSGRQ